MADDEKVKVTTAGGSKLRIEVSIYVIGLLLCGGIYYVHNEFKDLEKEVHQHAEVLAVTNAKMDAMSKSNDEHWQEFKEVAPRTLLPVRKDPAPFRVPAQTEDAGAITP